MNPPFGKCSQKGSAYFEKYYPDFKSDIGIAFVDKFLAVAKTGGCVGAITSRAFLASDSLKDWRANNLLEKTPIRCLLDLGYGVLDDAMVEAAAYVVDATPVLNWPRTFIRALESREKETSVRRLFDSGRAGSDVLIFLHDLRDFKTVPLAVMCYWLPASLLHKLHHLPTLPESGGAARHGLVTTDDWRFLRVAWEIAANSMLEGSTNCWKPLAKGGEYQPFWDDIHVCVDWSRNGNLLKTFLAEKQLKTQGSADWSPWLNHSEFYRLEGLTYPERTTSDFCPRVMPREVIFSSTGQAIQFNADQHLAFAYLCGSFTRFFKLIIESFVGSGDNAFPGSAAKHYRSGLLNLLPAPLLNGHGDVKRIAEQGIAFATELFSRDETARNFCPTMRGRSVRDTCRLTQESVLDRATQVIRSNLIIEELVTANFALTSDDMDVIDEIIGPHPGSYSASEVIDADTIVELWRKTTGEIVDYCIQKRGPRRQLTKKSFIADRKLELICHGLELPPETVVAAIKAAGCVDPQTLVDAAKSEISFAVGCAFGRWDIRFATGQRPSAALEDPFAPLPLCPPGLLQDHQGLPITKEEAERLQNEGRWGYPIDIPWDGILVDDPGHALDLEARVHKAFEIVWKDHWEVAERETCQLLGAHTLREYLKKPVGFFADHLKRYSKSRRQAPIYCPLSTVSGSYTIWVYYHRMSRDTLYQAAALAKDKLAHEERRLSELTRNHGANPTAVQRKGRAAQESFVDELSRLYEEIARVAPLWRPDINDGAILSYGPLWRMIAYRPWQKSVREVWDELCEGKYDWARLAMHLWPERVVPKCATDPSMAIAHDLDEVFWAQGGDGKWTKRQGSIRLVAELLSERISVAVKDALKGLTEGADASGSKARKRRQSS